MLEGMAPDQNEEPTRQSRLTEAQPVRIPPKADQSPATNVAGKRELSKPSR